MLCPEKNRVQNMSKKTIKKSLSFFLKKITVYSVSIYYMSGYICTVMVQLVLIIRFCGHSINALFVLKRVLAIHIVLVT